jgi:hypothetical protein
MNKVKVKEDKNKNVITVSENPEYGFITVEQDVIEINSKGWLKTTNRTALIHGKLDDLKLANYSGKTEIPGKIVVLESLTPFNAKNPDKDLKVAGKTGVICRYEDQPIYRQAIFTTNQNAFDELIPHTNTDEIKEVQLAQDSLSSLTIEEDVVSF